jgi:hypothetical protein
VHHTNKYGMRKFISGDRISLNDKVGEVLEFHGHSFDRDIYRVRFEEGDKLVSHINMRRARLDEGVRLNGIEAQAAFIVAVAEAYDAAPDHDRSADAAWQVLIRHTELTLFKRLKGSGIKVIFTEEDPYEIASGANNEMAPKVMLYDIVMNKTLKIFSGFSDNHPTFSPEQNVIFRAVHDFFTHGAVRKAFTDGLKKASREMGMQGWPALEDAGPLLSRVRLPSHTFTARGEFNATSNHVKLAPKAAAPAIFTEVTGQVCYYNIVGSFPDQKVAILKGFDYEHIGKCTPGSRAESRVIEIVSAIRRGDDTIPLRIRGKSSISTEDLLAAARR